MVASGEDRGKARGCFTAWARVGELTPAVRKSGRARWRCLLFQRVKYSSNILAVTAASRMSIFPGVCCAPATTGHAAALPSAAMKRRAYLLATTGAAALLAAMPAQAQSQSQNATWTPLIADFNRQLESGQRSHRHRVLRTGGASDVGGTISPRPPSQESAKQMTTTFSWTIGNIIAVASRRLLQACGFLTSIANCWLSNIIDAATLASATRPRYRLHTSKKLCGTYLRCMLIERMRRCLAAESTYIKPCLPPPPTSLCPAPTGFTRSSTTASGSCGPRDPVGIRLITRRGNDWTECYPLVVEALNHLKVRSCLIDGEWCVVTRRAWLPSNFSATAGTSRGPGAERHGPAA
jgi:hypothetical protein